MYPSAEQPRKDDIGRVSAGEVLHVKLEELILSDKYPPGSRLPTEQSLMERFGVSRTVVREAISSLAKHGLLDKRHGHRPIIRKPTFEVALETLSLLMRHMVGSESSARHLFESRIFMEIALVRHAALYAKHGDIERLRQALDDNRDAVDSAVDFYTTDVAFHGVLYGIPGNPVFVAMHKAFVAWLSDYWRKMEGDLVIKQMSHAAHATIFDAIARRAPEEAEAAMQSHLQTSWEYVRMVRAREAVARAGSR